MRLLPLLLLATSAPAILSAQFEFKNAEIRTTYSGAEQGSNGRLVVDKNTIRFVSNNGQREYFGIPSGSVTDLFYSRVSGRRIKTAIIVSPLLLLSKGRKHYMTITFDDKRDMVGAVEFQLDKNNYRGVLRALEQVTGVSMQYDQEGVKESEQIVATRSDASEKPSAPSTGIHITSDPPQAEIEIDGAFAGTSPREKALQPGKYKIRVSRQGFKPWEREVIVSDGESFDVHAILDPN